jgi:ferredoxin
MAVIVTDNCQLCRFSECVAVCPVACFHGDDEMLYVDPDVCVDCGACVPVCPVKAIYFEHDLPTNLAHWISINRDRASALPPVTEQAAPLATAQAKRTSLGF